MKNLFTTKILFYSILLTSCSIIQSKHPENRNRLVEEVENDAPDAAWKQNFELTKDPALGYPPTERLAVVRDLIDNAQHVNKAIKGISWEERGPNNIGGRTRAIMWDPNDPAHKKVWAGGVDGGLWFTNDIYSNTPIWNKVNDFWDNIAISCIAFDPAHSNRFYVGTGEGWYNLDAVKGNGIMYSDDSGNSWNIMSGNSTGIFNFVQKIAINNTGIYVATKFNGIYRTQDNGVNWERVLSAANGSIDNRAADIEIGSNGNNDDIIYVSIGMKISNFFSNSDGIYKSSTGNLGDWTKINPNGATTGFNRIELATSKQNKDLVYALVNNDNNTTSIFKTTDAGLTWIQQSNPPELDAQLINGNFARSQGWYNLIAAVDPNNDNSVFIGGIDLFKSINGGASWTQISQWDIAFGTTLPVVHGDQHNIQFVPGSSSHILFSNDGGIYFAQNGSSASPTFANKNNGYNVAQFYSCAIDPAPWSNNFLCGSQDNGTQQFNNPGINSTNRIVGGDGTFCFIRNNSVQIASTPGENYYITNDNWATTPAFRSSGQGLPECGTYFVNPSDYDKNKDILFFQSRNTLNCFPKISKITSVSTNPSAELYISLPGLTNINHGPVTHIRVSPFINSNYNTNLFIGSSDIVAVHALIYKVIDANTNNPSLVDITGTLNVNGSISCIEIGATENDLLVTFSNYGISSVWQTHDGGLNWEDKDAGFIPDMPVRWALYNPNDRKEVLLATEAGVWSTDNIELTPDAFTWEFNANSGIARVRVDMLKCRDNPTDRTVIAATHGRGVFTSGIFNHPIADFTDVCFGMDIKFIPDIQSNINPVTYSWDFGDGSSFSTDFIPTHTYSTPGNYDVTLTATNSGGSGVVKKTITVVPICCGSYNAQSLSQVNFTGNQTTIGAGFYNLSSNIVIDNGDEIIIDNADISIAQGVSITINHGKLTIRNHSILRACGDFWQGIFLTDNNSNIVANSSSTIRDALVAVNIKDGANYSLMECKFLHNDISIKLLNNYFSNSITSKCVFDFQNLSLRETTATAHIWIENSSDMVIGNTGISNQNDFKHSMHAIVAINSYGTIIQNNNFHELGQELMNDANQWYTSGTAIKVIGGTIEVKGSSVSWDQNIFNSLKNTGIYIESATAQIHGNLFSEISSGIEIYKSQNENIHIYENGFKNFHAGIYGVELINSEIEINNNHFNMVLINTDPTQSIPIYASTPTLTQYGAYAINIENQSRNFLKLNCHNNWIANARVGIHFRNLEALNLQDVIAQHNQIFYTHLPNRPEGLEKGIWLENSSLCQISNNHIRNKTYTPDIVHSHTLTGIKLDYSPNNVVLENYIKKMGFSLFSSYNCEETKFYCNTMEDYCSAVRLYKSVLPEQGSGINDECWNNIFLGNMTGNYKITGNPALNIDWDYSNSDTDPNPIDLSNPHTVIAIPVNQLISTCLPPGINSRENERTEKFGKIVYDQKNYTSDNLFNRYYDLKYYYQEMSKDSTLLTLGTPEDSVYLNLFDSLRNSNIGKFNEANYLIKSGNLFNALTKFENLSDDNIIEYYQKSVAEIYLNCKIQNRDPDEFEKLLLDPIANEVGLYGGDGTYMARSLLKILIDDNELLNTARYKKPEFYTYHSKYFSNRSNNLLYPNPASSVIYFNLPERNDKNVKIQINDYLNRELRSYFLSSLNNQINIEDLKNGFYFIYVLQDGKILQTEKIIVLH